MIQGKLIYLVTNATLRGCRDLVDCIISNPQPIMRRRIPFLPVNILLEVKPYLVHSTALSARDFTISSILLNSSKHQNVKSTIKSSWVGI